MHTDRRNSIERRASSLMMQEETSQLFEKPTRRARIYRLTPPAFDKLKEQLNAIIAEIVRWAMK